MFRYGLTLRVDFGNLAGGRDTGIDRGCAFLREFRLLAEEDHAECRAFHNAAWVGSVKRMQHRDYWTQNNVIQRIGENRDLFSVRAKQVTISVRTSCFFMPLNTSPKNEKTLHIVDT